jgi:hypothetical protein
VELLRSVLEWAKDRKATIGTAVVLICVNIIAHIDALPEWLHFYDADVLDRYRSWAFLFIVLAIISIILSQRWLGFTIILAAFIFLAIFFGQNYSESGAGKSLFIVWLAYRSMLALLIGLGVKVASYVASL